MKKIKLYIRIAISWLKLKCKNTFYKRRMKKIQAVRMAEFKKEAPQKIEIKKRPGKNVDLFAYDPDLDVTYQVLMRNNRVFVNPDHPYTWAMNYRNAERKLRKICPKCIYEINKSGRKIKTLKCEFCNTENNITNITENLKQ